MPKSLDDLARIQQSYEKELANKKQAELETAQQKAVEATALAERKELAKKELVRHADLIEELRQLDEDAKRAEVLRIEERAKKAEELNKTLEERRVALDLLEQEAREAVDYFEKFTGFIAEKEQIAPEVLAAYKEAETVKQGLENDVANLASEIEKMSAGMATQEEIDRYKTLQKRIDELNQELESLIENPHVLEGLIEQGESEEAIKSTFIERVIQDHHAVEPERQKFLEDITRSFLEEELRSKGIAAIADPDERQKAIKTFVRGMYAGYHNTYIDEKSMDRGMIRAVYGILDEVEIKDHIKAECAGFALKSILYPNASGHLVMSHMRAAVDGTDPYQSWQKNNKNFQDRTKAGVEAHMGTLNLLLSYERGVRVNQHILGGKRSMWTDMSQSFFEMGFGYGLDDESRAFLPSPNNKDYKKGDRELILRVFERDVARAERMDQRILESDISSMEREIVDLEEQARILKETRDTLIPAEETIRRLNSLYQMGYKEDSSGYVPSGLVVSNPASRERVANAVKWEEKKIQDIKDNIEVLETELVKIRAQWFSGKAEKAKNDEITNLRSKLLLLEPREGESAELEKKKADLAAWDAAAAIIKGKESAYTPSYMLTRSLTDIETRFLQKKHELSVLQRGLLKKD